MTSCSYEAAHATLKAYVDGKTTPTQAFHCQLGNLSQLAQYAVANNFTCVLDLVQPQLPPFPGRLILQPPPCTLTGQQLRSAIAPIELVKQFLSYSSTTKGRWTIWSLETHPRVYLVEYHGEELISAPPPTVLPASPIPSVKEVALQALNRRDLLTIVALFQQHPCLSSERIFDYGWTWLHQAIRMEWFDSVQYFAQTFPSMINQGALCNGNTPLHQAAYRGNCKIIEFLIENGANLVRLTSPGGHLAVHHASMQGHRGAVFLLLDAMKEKGYAECSWDSLLYKSAPNRHLDDKLTLIKEWFVAQQLISLDLIK